MIWSTTGKSKKPPALHRFLVRLRSDTLDLQFPEGWLCTRTIADASKAKARPNINLGSATVPDYPPEEILISASTWFDLFKSKSQNSSC